MKVKKIVSVLLSFVLIVAMFVPEQVSAEETVTSNNILYQSDFSGSALPTGWSTATNAKVGSQKLYNTSKTFVTYMNESFSGASTLTDCSVSADVTLTGTDYSGNAVAGIALRSTENSWYGGYILKLNYKNNKTLLYSESESGNKLVELTSKTLSTLDTPVTLELNEAYSLKLSAVGDMLIGYVDDVEVLRFEASDTAIEAKSATKNDSGYPGVMVNSGTVKFEKFTVETIANEVATVFYQDTFSEYDTTDIWQSSSNAQVYNNSLTGKDSNTFNTYLSAVTEVCGLEDCSVETDVTMTAPNEDGSAMVGVALRSAENSWYGGYVLKLNYKNNKALLYSKNESKDALVELTSKTLSTLDTPVTLELNEAYSLKLSAVGDMLIGYVDDVEVLRFEASDTAIEAKSATKNDSGYPGVMINSGVAYFENFVVSEIPENSIVIDKVATDATVYVDGKASAEAKATGIVQANPGQSIQIITIDDNDSNKIATNEVYLVKADGTVVQPECLQDAISYDETAIRSTGNKGIRFKSSVTKSAKAGDEEFVLQEYGTVVTKETILNGDDLYLGATYATVKGKAYDKANNIDFIFGETDTSYYFTGVLVKIAEANYSTTYVARPYAIYEDTAGTQYKIYGNMIGRSLYEVAQLALADTEFGYTETEKSYFQGIVDYVTGGQTE